MTVIRGLAEALVYLVVGVVLAAVAALVWVAVVGGDYARCFGTGLIAIGALLSVTGNLTASKVGMADTRAWFGHGAETEELSGRVLTNVGIFLFVSIPLVALGALLVA